MKKIVLGILLVFLILTFGSLCFVSINVWNQISIKSPNYELTFPASYTFYPRVGENLNQELEKVNHNHIKEGIRIELEDGYEVIIEEELKL